MHCSTCSLVSSSGQLRFGKRGEEIDRSKCVIRMNDAPTAGFQRDVGRRTTLRVVAHSSLKLLLRRRAQLLNVSQDTAYVFWGPSGSMQAGGRGSVFNSLATVKGLLPHGKMYVVSRGKMLSSDELFKKETGMDRKKSNSWLSTGWFAMCLAMELCGTINVFGMVPPDLCSSPTTGPSVPYHYYEPKGRSECSTYVSHERSRQGSHRFITEKMVFSGWARSHDIRFHQPDWTPPTLLPALDVSTTNASRQILPNGMFALIRGPR
ncbi:hypothetical protein NHX12_032966 [Muraenolepis orangiensis]|uniref:Alpha-N-acetylgalactosaminide alpha-2,6-sialyltransferase 5 n=1 Tax=Muraenolepis orangiensis TaxID=630683 RepID=A0A9Q0E314_9TELE|nr:hypothetical protein NHX12_032966 [Muraenolepis orangiensis]